MLAVMNQFTGINGVMYYAYDILHDAGVPNVGCLFPLMLSDDPSVLSKLLQEVIKDFSSQASLMAVVHKRHVKVFSQKKFQTCVEWKNYDKMHYLPEVES